MAENVGDLAERRAPHRRSILAPYDEHLLLRDDFEHGGRRKSAPLVPMPNLELRGFVWIAVRDDALDRPAAAAREREADAVREPVARDGTCGSKPLRSG